MGANISSSLGAFSYPPLGSTLHFNYVDSIITSWEVFDSNATDCFLSVWYWPGAGSWQMGMSTLRPDYGQFSTFGLKLDVHDTYD